MAQYRQNAELAAKHLLNGQQGNMTPHNQVQQQMLQNQQSMMANRIAAMAGNANVTPSSQILMPSKPGQASQAQNQIQNQVQIPINPVPAQISTTNIQQNKVQSGQTVNGIVQNNNKTTTLTASQADKLAEIGKKYNISMGK